MLDGTYQVQRFSYRVVEKWKPNYYWESIFQTFQRQSEPQLSSTIQELNLQARLSIEQYKKFLDAGIQDISTSI